MPFICAHWGDILVIVLLAIIVISIIRYFYKRKKKGHSLACIGCPEADHCMAAQAGCPSGQRTCQGPSENKNEV